jgi:hypothetical protein
VFELRASHFLGRHSTTWTRHAVPFAFSYISNRVLPLYISRAGLWSFYLLFLHSWDDWCTTMTRFYWLRQGLANFLPWPAATHNPLSLYLQVARISSDYRHEPPWWPSLFVFWISFTVWGCLISIPILKIISELLILDVAKKKTTFKRVKVKCEGKPSMG